MDVLTIDQYLPAIGSYEPNEVFQKHTLPGAAAPHHRHDLATPDVEAQALQHHLASEAFVQIAYLNERGLSHHRSTEFRK